LTLIDKDSLACANFVKIKDFPSSETSAKLSYTLANGHLTK
jgi:hypothetical protein